MEIQKTHIDGLDTLLRRGSQKEGRGIVILEGKPLSVLLKGFAGSGKTTLSLQLATSISGHPGDKNDKYYCVYFHADQTSNEIAALFNAFNWKTKLLKIYPNLTEYCEYKDSGWSDKKNLGSDFDAGVYIFDLASLKHKEKEELDEIRLLIQDTIAVRLKRWPRLVIVDSLNIIDEYRKGVLSRENIHRFTSDSPEYKPTPIFLFTLEKTKDAVNRNFDYFFNMVIDLDEFWDSDYYFRTIQIEKARNQEHVLGKHQYKINTTNGGMVIMPSLHYVMSEYKKQPFAGKEILSTGIPGLDDMLMKEKNKKGILDRSATVIVGEPGARKSPIALNFLKEGVLKGGVYKKGVFSGERVLLLSLREDESNVIKTVESYGMREMMTKPLDLECSSSECQLKQIFNDKNKKAYPEEEYNSLFRIEYFRPGFISPDEFVHKILRIIKEYEICQGCQRNNVNEAHLQKIRFKRVVLDDIAQFALRFPLLGKSSILLSTLIDIFKSEGLTSMFIDIIEKNEPYEKKQTLSEIVDNIFVVRHLSFYGKNRTGISVGRLHGGVYASDFREVCVKKSEKGDIISVEPNFDRFVKLESGEPIHAPLEVSLYEESLPHVELPEDEETYSNRRDMSRLEKQLFSPFHMYNNLMKRSLKSVFEGHIEIKRITRNDDENYHFSILKRKDVPLTSTKVVTIDEFWVETLIHEDSAKSCLVELGKDRFKKDIFGEEGEFEKIFVYKDKRSEVKESEGSQMQIRKKFLIPYFLNMQLLCFNKKRISDGLKNLNDHKNFQILDGNRVSDLKLDWNIIESIGNSIKKEDECILSYYGGHQHAESLNCLFLDLVWDNKEEMLDLSKLSDNKGAVNNITAFKRIAVESKDKGFPPKKALFWVSWFSDLIRFIREQEQSGEKSEEIENICIAPLPNGGISGEWYIGILRGSVSPIVGAEAVKYISSLELDREKLTYGVGLPARRFFYDIPLQAWKGGPPLQELLKIFHGTHARSQVKDYIKMRDDIELKFRRLCKEDDVGKVLSKSVKF
jgi:KaiC/GvpD/RAD55 family RecA-like ATPase